jgi:hypothetical protein
MTEPNQKLLDDPSVPRITLAGQEWPVPKFAIAQNAVILPILMAHFEHPDVALRTTEGILRLGTILFTALGRGHKDMTRADFDDMPIEVPEMAAAIPVIAQQTGMYKATKPNGVDRPLAPTPEALPTGPQ